MKRIKSTRCFAALLSMVMVLTVVFSNITIAADYVVEEGVSGEAVPEGSALAEEPAEAIPTAEYVYEDDEKTVAVTLTDGSAIPEGSELKVRNLTAGMEDQSDKEKFEWIDHFMNEKAAASQFVIHGYTYYDIYFLYNGSEIVPGAGEMQVTITYKRDNVTDTYKNSDQSGKEIRVFQLTEGRNENNETVYSMEDLAGKGQLSRLEADQDGNVTAIEFNEKTFLPLAVIWKEDPKAEELPGDTGSSDDTVNSDGKETGGTEEGQKPEGSQNEVDVKQDVTFQYTDDSVEVSAVTEKGSLPENAVLHVEKITKEHEDFEKAEKAVDAVAKEKQKEVKDLAAYDIKFMVGDKEAEPLSPVSVSMKFVQQVELKDADDSSNDVSLLHVKDDGNTEVVEASISQQEDGKIEEVEFQTDGFSMYILYVNGQTRAVGLVNNSYVNVETNGNWGQSGFINNSAQNLRVRVFVDEQYKAVFPGGQQYFVKTGSSETFTITPGSGYTYQYSITGYARNSSGSFNPSADTLLDASYTKSDRVTVQNMQNGYQMQNRYYYCNYLDIYLTEGTAGEITSIDYEKITTDNLTLETGKAEFVNGEARIPLSYNSEITEQYAYNSCQFVDAQGKEVEGYTAIVQDHELVITYDETVSVTKTKVRMIYGRKLSAGDVTTTKTASLTDTPRMYQLDLTAVTTPVSIDTNGIFTFLLDISGSMIFTDCVAAKSYGELEKLDQNWLYFTSPFYNVDNNYGYGIALDNTLSGRLSPNMKDYSGRYTGVPERGYFVYYDNGAWYRQDYQYSYQAQGINRQMRERITESNFNSKVGTLYTQRSKILIDTMTDFINDLPDGSAVNIVQFGLDDTGKSGAKVLTNSINTQRNEVISLGSNRSTVLSKLKEAFGYYQASTYIGRGLQVMNTEIIEKIPAVDKRAKYSIVFTDGVYNGSVSDLNTVSAISNIRAKSEVFTIGFGDFNESSKELLTQILPSKPNNAFVSDQQDDIKNAFASIGSQVGGAISGAVITDYIDQRFELVKEDGTPYAQGDSVAGGILKQDENGFYIEWHPDSIGITDKTKWSASFYVKAKDDFVGGNVITTNGSPSEVTAGGTQFPFDKPTVNVPLLGIEVGNAEEVIFKGDTAGLESAYQNITDAIRISGGPNINILNQEQLEKLLADKNLEVPYAYGDTMDNVGTFTFQLRENPDGSSVLTVTYTAYTEAARPHDGVKDAVGNEVHSVSASGRFDVHTVAGQLQITKKIDQQYSTISQINSNQTFVFKIEQYGVNEDGTKGELVNTFYETIQFVANEKNSELSSAVITDLPKGYYTITEEESWSGKYKNISVKDNYNKNLVEATDLYIGEKTALGNKPSFYGLEQKAKYLQHASGVGAAVTFTNQLKNSTEWKWLSDAAAVINKFIK